MKTATGYSTWTPESNQVLLSDGSLKSINDIINKVYPNGKQLTTLEEIANFHKKDYMEWTSVANITDESACNSIGYPYNNYGIILSVPSPTSGYGRQLFFDDNSNLILARHKNSSGWQKWLQFVFKSDLNNYLTTSAADGKYLKLSGGTETGVVYSDYKSETWVKSLTSSAITLNDTANSFGGWICGPTKNGRIVISTYLKNDDYLYFGYGERGREANSYQKKMYWDGPNNTLYADKFSGALSGTATGNLTGISYDSTNQKLQQTKNGSTTDVVEFGSNAFNSTSYLPLTGGTLSGELVVNAVHRDNYYASNLCRCAYTTDATEFVIKTRIKFANATLMPVVRIYGYAYGVAYPIELAIVFYVYDNTFYKESACCTGGWKPDVYLFKYTEDSVNYVAIGLKGSCYYCGFQVDALVGSKGAFEDTFKTSGWTITSNASDTTVSLIPAVSTNNCKKIGYCSLATNISGTATKLATARNISLGTAVASTAVSFDGSEDITIPVDSVYDSYLTFGGKNIVSDISPVGMAISSEHNANRLAFINGDAITCEYSSDGGSSWTNYNWSATKKSDLCTTTNLSLYIGKPDGTAECTASSRSRVTICACNGSKTYFYTVPKKLFFYVKCTLSLKVLVEYKKGSETSWTTYEEYKLEGNTNWNEVPCILNQLGGYSSQTSNIWYLRLTFIITSVGNNSSNNKKAASIQGIRLFGSTDWVSASKTNNKGSMSSTGHLYSYDTDANAIFPASIITNGDIYEGGNSDSSKLSNKYAPKSHAHDYIPISGNSTSTPITGTLYFKNKDALHISNNNLDTKIWTVSGDGDWAETYGFTLTYKGSGSGNNNTLELISHNLAGSKITAAKVTQDGAVTFNTTPTVNGTSVSLSNHSHSNYLPLSGGTLTGLVTTKSASSDTLSGIKFGGTTITSYCGQALWLGERIRFSDVTAFDWDKWAGLKYDSANKIIYLGLADGTIFTAGTAQSGGKLYLPGISSVYVGNGTTAVSLSGHTHDYLPLSGGTVSSGSFAPLKIERTDGTYAAGIEFKNTNGTLGYIGMTQNANGKLLRWGTDTSKYYEILDSSSSNVSNNGETYINGVNPISKILEGTSAVTDGTMFITSIASNNGFADTGALNRPYKRKASCLYSYIKAKTDVLYSAIGHSHSYLPLSGGTMSGGINFSSASPFTWNSDTYRQRISVTDDSTANTAVFTFQQSSNAGSSWTDLFTIKDNGTIIASKFSGHADSASVLTDDETIKLYAQSSNEINFGGTSSSTNIYIGCSSIDNRPVPTDFYFGNSTDTSNVRAGAFYVNGKGTGYVLTSGGTKLWVADSYDSDTLVARTSNGYIRATYFYSRINKEDSITPDAFYFSKADDYFIRKISYDKLKSLLNSSLTVYEANLQWGGNDLSGNISPIDAAMSSFHSANRALFCKPEGVTVEYTTDGTNWDTYKDPSSTGTSVVELSDASKINLMSDMGTSLYIGGSSSVTITTNCKLRITLDASSMGMYTDLRKMLINVTTNGATNCQVVVEYSKNSSETTWINLKTCTISGWSGWNSISFPRLYFGSTNTGNAANIRLTFQIGGITDGSVYGNRLCIRNILLFGVNAWTCPSTMALTGHLYRYNYEQNAFFPKKVYLNNTSTLCAAVLRKTSSNDYWQLRLPDGGDDWLSVPSNGILPSSKNSSTGQSSLGNSSWYFKSSYIKNMYGTAETSSAVNIATGTTSHPAGNYKFVIESSNHTGLDANTIYFVI